MRPSRILAAGLSEAIFCSKKVFERTLQQGVGTVFGYYYNIQVGKLGNTESLKYNNTFRRFVRHEWENMSITKRRLYSAMFFQYNGLRPDHMGSYELAKCLGVETPAASEYLLFRNRFKAKFDLLWEKDPNVDLSQVFDSNLLQAKNLRVRLKSSRRSWRNAKILEGKTNPNYLQRFKEMCKECRRIWRTEVTDNEKQLVRAQWEQDQAKFKSAIQEEITSIMTNMERFQSKPIMNGSSKDRLMSSIIIKDE
ncbi:Uncharacterized protein RNJ44_02481 [Nakaseomyces bracarensis]|uniref:Uncharacterized protein n=1 Tax=Nakaseomyces bracarensis TaxID=273131 RepID=A0ABR4NLU1_9SACH